jgi:hypothetical protein
MRTISTSHKHHNHFSRIYIENVLKCTQFVRRNVGINISKVLNCKNVLKMLVFICPHSLNTLQARVIDIKLYCDDVMGGSTRSTRPRSPLPYTTNVNTRRCSTTLLHVNSSYAHTRQGVVCDSRLIMQPCLRDQSAMFLRSSRGGGGGGAAEISLLSQTNGGAKI